MPHDAYAKALLENMTEFAEENKKKPQKTASGEHKLLYPGQNNFILPLPQNHRVSPLQGVWLFGS